MTTKTEDQIIEKQIADLTYSAEKEGVPDHTINPLVMYIVYRIPPGGFLRAVLENDLMEAFGRADQTNALCMKNIVSFIYNYAPMQCHGSNPKVQAWINEASEVIS